MLILLLFSLCSFTLACHPQFEKELRYLDLYLGIQPTNEGEIIEEDASKFAAYVSEGKKLNCDPSEPCLWKNAVPDGLLDTSDWWLFKKTDDKQFPVQIQPGHPEIPVGTHMFVAGNTSHVPESAVLLSAPIACQRGSGTLSFNYWLYNHAKVEVIVVRATNRRKHLQTLSRPAMNCHFLRPAKEICTVTIPRVNEPFRFAIRAFNLKDNVVGSMALINNITYKGETCGESPFPSIFHSVSLEPRKDDKPMESLAELNCHTLRKGCKWSNAESAQSEWRVGRSIERWSSIMETSSTETAPNSSFVFLAVDSLSPRPYATLRSQLIPCTQMTTTLSFRYWMKSGTQVELCSVDEDNIPLSCAYLTEEDSPGPIDIDVDAFDRPFRFTVEVIAFDETSLGLIVISDIKVKGLLCSQKAPLVVTTIDPPTIVSMFGLQRAPSNSLQYPLTLDCDFSKDYCNQWVNDDGSVAYGVVPKHMNEKFPLPRELRGNVAVFVLKGKMPSILRSREVSCAHNAVVSVDYFRSEHASLHICAMDKCVEAEKEYGTLSIPVSSMKAFEITLECQSSADSVVIIRSISVQGDVCPLKSAEQLICEKLKCSFQDGFCSFDSPVEQATDVALTGTPNGLSVVLDRGSPRAILRSPVFDLPYPSLLVLSVTQNTFGSRLLLCPDVSSLSDLCHELLGPRVLTGGPHRVVFPIDPRSRRFALVFSHDHPEQFGAASFQIHSIDIRTEQDAQLCF